MLTAIALQCDELVFHDQLRVIQQATDEGRLAVIDRAAGQEPQRGRVRRRCSARRRHGGGHFRGRAGGGSGGLAGRASRPRGGICLGLTGHQKYPSRFFFSIDAASSLSMRRPERSEVRDVIISSMMSSSVAAVLSIAADKG